MGLIGLPETPEERAWLVRTLAARDGWNCIWCSRTLGGKERATLEHLIPRAHGGSDGQANLCLACASCNHDRGDSDALYWLGICKGRGLAVRTKLVMRRLRLLGVVDDGHSRSRTQARSRFVQRD